MNIKYKCPGRVPISLSESSPEKQRWRDPRMQHKAMKLSILFNQLVDAQQIREDKSKKVGILLPPRPR